MARDLRYNTAVVVVVGPLIDIADGYTTVDAATVTDIDCGIKKAGTAGAAISLTASEGANDMTPTANNPGHYDLEIPAADVSALGPLRYTFNDVDVFIPFWEDFNVLTQAEYDRKYSTGASVADIETQLAAAGGVTLSGTAAAGGDATITLTGGVATDSYYNGQVVVVTDGTGVGQSRRILSYVGSTTVATVAENWVVNPSSDSVFVVFGSVTDASIPIVEDIQTQIGTAGDGLTDIASVAAVAGAVGSVTGAVGSVTGAVGSVTGNVGGNVAGSVASVVGAVGSVTGAVGSVTGNVGGNVTGTIGGLSTQAKADVNAEADTALSDYAPATASALTTHDGKLDTAQADLDTLTGSDGATLATSQPNYAPEQAKLIKNTTGILTFPMYNATTRALDTGLTVTGQVSIDGAAYGAVAGSIAEIGSTGTYKFTYAQADTNGDDLMFLFTATGAKPTVYIIKTTE